MAGIPKVKVTFDADLDQLKRGVKGAQSEVEGFGDKVSDFGKKAGLAFAAAGAAAAAYAGKLLIDGVKAAMEDEAAQLRLATSLQNVTGATNAQIAAVESYITKTSLAIGKTDDELRPAFDRLVRSTKDVGEAQDLMTIALDVSAGTGKSLASVSEALAKAHDGNFGALKKLGAGIDENIIKSKDYDGALAALSGTFEGQATKQADTFQGKMARLSIGFNEAKETVGKFVIDGLQPLLTVFLRDIIPVIQNVAEKIGKVMGPVFADLGEFFRTTLIPIIKALWNWFSEIIIPGIVKTVVPIIGGLKDAFDSVKTAVSENIDKFKPLMEFMMAIYEFIYTKLYPIIGKGLGEGFKILGGIIGDVIGFLGTVAESIMKIVNGAIDGINKLIRAYNMIPFLDDVPEISIRKFEIEMPTANGGKTTVTGFDVGGGGGGGGGFDFGGGGGLGGGGGNGGSTQIDTGAAQQNVSYSYAELEAMGATGFALSAENLARNISGTQMRPTAPPVIINNNVSVGVAGDPEQTARSIIGLLNGSQGRGTLGAGALVAG